MKRKVCQKRRILLMLIFALIFHCRPAYARTKSIQRKIVSIAQAEIGRGETAADNRGEDIRKYLRGKENLSWCAGFVAWVLEQAGINEQYPLSARAIFNQAKTKGLFDPKPGDLIIFWRNSKEDWRGHIGIVSRVNEKKIWTIEGNRGSFPAKVKEFEYQRNNIPKLLGFIRVESEVKSDAPENQD